MEIKYTRHAQRRMQQRKVALQQIVETLDMPDHIEEGEQGEEVAIKQYAHRELRVVYRLLDENSYLIITVIYPKLKRR